MNKQTLDEIMKKLEIDASDISMFYDVPISVASIWIKDPSLIPINICSSLYSLCSLNYITKGNLEEVEIVQFPVPEFNLEKGREEYTYYILYKCDIIQVVKKDFEHDTFERGKNK